MQASNDSFTDINVGTIAVTPVDCVKASSGPGDMNHFELRIAQGGIDVYATDAGTLAPLKKIATIGLGQCRLRQPGAGARSGL